MYAALFGLSQEPFSIAPDPHFLYMSERHREALAHLLYGVQGGGGFVLLTGAVGAGKTTVCRCFVEQLPRSCQLAYIFNPKLSVPELLATVCEEFGLPAPAGGTVKDYVDPLNEFLLTSHAQGKSSVLIIDEAQNLSTDVLEQLRLLTNLETDTRKLLQIILIGQPELRDRLARPDMAQLAQRVIARYHLEALGEAETAQYVRHRLAVAGLQGALPFDARALQRIHRLAHGVPRRINLLCDRALLGAYAQSRTSVDAAMVNQAAREAFGEEGPPQPRSRGVWMGVAAVLLLLLGAAVGWLTSGGRAGPWLAGARAVPPAAAAASSAVSAAAGSVPAPATLALPAASAPAAAVATPAVPLLDAAALAATAPWPDEAAAWRALAARWSLAPAGPDPCETLAAAALACHRGPATLALIRQLDRPGWLPLSQPVGPALPVLLTGLGERHALLLLPEGPVRVSLATLASRWTGEFATLWRLPPSDGTAAWINARLAGEQAGTLPDGAPLRSRVEAFQRAQGLAVDGRAGPLTLMQLNRVAAVAEPRLTGER
ncbi:MAG: AAA family ATPase [Rubrivivax sp.]|nr:AAA family ATPase [Rubrivivax sp.]